MIVWKSIEELTTITNEILECIPKDKYKSISQIENALDSAGANFVEGYYSGCLGEYIKFIKYAHRSCAELLTRVTNQRLRGVIGENIFEKFKERCVKTMYLLDRTRQSLELKRDADPKKTKK